MGLYSSGPLQKYYGHKGTGWCVSAPGGSFEFDLFFMSPLALDSQRSAIALGTPAAVVQLIFWQPRRSNSALICLGLGQ